MEEVQMWKQKLNCHLESMGISQTKKEDILSKLNSRQPVRKKAPQMNKSQSQNQIALDEQSDYYEAATNCFKIVEAPGKGRYAVATSDLDAGTLVLQEDPVTSCLLPEA